MSDGGYITPGLRTDLAANVARLHRFLVDRAPTESPSDRIARDAIEALVRTELPLCSDADVAALVAVLDERLHGLGVLDPLLQDPTIGEIMVNGPGMVWVERAGRLEPTGVELDHEAIRVVIDRIVGPLGLRIDRVVPFVDARLPDGSRVHITVPPMAVDGPYITIRRFGERQHSLRSYCTDIAVFETLRGAVADRATILVTGQTSAGKTSLLNALAGHIEPASRVVTIEDAAELRLAGDHVVRLESRPANAEGVGELTMQTLVRNALRMRPDRLVVGEVRGGEALDMIQALSTGHRGSMATCHANSAADGLDRVVAMALGSGGTVPPRLVRTQIERALDLVVHVERDDLGRRRVTEILRLDEHGQHHDRIQSRLGSTTSQVAS